MEADFESDIKDENSPIRQFFHGRSVFITGATGLVGKVLLEKLLRCCSGINKVYILMRPKRGKTTDERKKDLLEAKLFSLVQKQSPSFVEKIVVVDGDITKSDLDISKEDRKALEENVSVVFHSAAMVKFREHLRVAVQQNILGTQHVLNLCRKMDQLTAVIYVSTAYCVRNDDGTVPEAIEKCKPSLEQVLNALEWMDDDTVSAVTPTIVGNKINTYFITKCLTENFISERYGDLPIAIVRPSAILNTWKDPIPGWSDSLQGALGLFMAVGKGLLRALHYKPGCKINVIPLDILVNTLISTTYYIGTERFSKLLIVNCTFDEKKLPKLFEELIPLYLEERYKYPLSRIFRYPNLTMYQSKPLYWIHIIIDQFIPAALIDIFLFIFTGKTKIVRALLKFVALYEDVMLISPKLWDFQRDNYLKIMKIMSEEDSKIFFMDLKDFDWKEYAEISALAGRRYLAKEDPSTIPYAKKKEKIDMDRMARK